MNTPQPACDLTGKKMELSPDEHEILINTAHITELIEKENPTWRDLWPELAA